MIAMRDNVALRAVISCRQGEEEEEEEHSTSSIADCSLRPSRLLTQSWAEEEEERSSCFLPSCREEVPSLLLLLEEGEGDSSSRQSFHCCRSSVVPRAAGLSDSSAAWPRTETDLPSLPSCLMRLEQGVPVWLRVILETLQMTELHVQFLEVRLLAVLECRHQAPP